MANEDINVVIVNPNPVKVEGNLAGTVTAKLDGGVTTAPQQWKHVVVEIPGGASAAAFQAELNRHTDFQLVSAFANFLFFSKPA